MVAAVSGAMLALVRLARSERDNRLRSQQRVSSGGGHVSAARWYRLSAYNLYVEQVDDAINRFNSRSLQRSLNRMRECLGVLRMRGVRAESKLDRIEKGISLIISIKNKSARELDALRVPFGAYFSWRELDNTSEFADRDSDRCDEIEMELLALLEEIALSADASGTHHPSP